MTETLLFGGILEHVMTAYDKNKRPFLDLTIDGKPFRYFKGDEEHKAETLRGLLQFRGQRIEGTHTEKQIEGRRYPYRNIMSFTTEFTRASALDMGHPQEAGAAELKQPAAPAGPSTVAPEEKTRKPDYEGLVVPPRVDELEEMIISQLTEDPDVLILQRCIKMSVVAWQPQMQEWKAVGLEPSADCLVKRIGETATSFYISKKQERR